MNDFILEQYDENQEIYLKISQLVESKLNEIVESLGIDVNIVKSRIKAKDSLSKKLELKPSKYKSIFDLTDIVGSRIVTYYKNDADKIAARVIANFDVDWENSIDKSKLYSVNQFGYLSMHFIVRIPKTMFFEEGMEMINEIRSEIQIRTNLQHTWAAIFHDTGYKSDIEIPLSIQRKFSRLAGLLEMADDEFQSIRDSLAEYRRMISSVVKSGKYDDIELTKDSFEAYVSGGAFNELTNKIASINSMEVQQVPLHGFLKIFKYFEFKTLKDLDDFVKQNSEEAYKLSLLQFSDTDIDIITDATAPLSLCSVYILKSGYGYMELKNMFDVIFGNRRSNTSLSQKLYQYGVTLGLAKDLNKVEA